jgi:hypothetical protein
MCCKIHLIFVTDFSIRLNLEFSAGSAAVAVKLQSLRITRLSEALDGRKGLRQFRDDVAVFSASLEFCAKFTLPISRRAVSICLFHASCASTNAVFLHLFSDEAIAVLF